MLTATTDRAFLPDIQGEYLSTLDQCTAVLFSAISERHKVKPQQARESIDNYRHTSLDAVIMLFFSLAYGLFVDNFVRGIWRRLPPKQDWLLGIMATIVISPVISLLGVVLRDSGPGRRRFCGAQKAKD